MSCRERTKINTYFPLVASIILKDRIIVFAAGQGASVICAVETRPLIVFLSRVPTKSPGWDDLLLLRNGVDLQRESPAAPPAVIRKVLTRIIRGAL